MRQGTTGPRPTLPTATRTVGCTAAIVLGVVALIGALTSGFVVQAGNVGVVTTFGSVEPGVLYPGLHIRVPFINQIHPIDVRVQPHEFKEIDAASLEQQTVKLTGTMNYHLDPARANELYQIVGLDFATKVIDPAFSDYIKEVLPRYRASDILQKRDEIRQTTKDKLSTNLFRYGIVVDDIYISDVAFSTEYQQAIEGKQTQQQNVGREEQTLAQKQIQAQQKLVDATGEANAAIERARGESEANRVRSQNVSPELVRYIEATRWDGRLPQVTSGGVPLIQLGEPASSSAPASPAAPDVPAVPTAAPALPTAQPRPTAVPAQPTPTPAQS